ncbi:LPP20 family lipoprotein [Lacimicrobium alkaliphilum]|uniref:Flagellar biosynthesis protein FlgP n=1 Tax=Lacimicrobium alkaliphilum TaxID=1526571 RepID=A0A0U3B217_9ALTE|nr:LPP20 family lipoprotein [Lacimicrobium alkaliphilum]ALS99104.1 flagellar biosynthesis protein FlgP [Lacimicrobium alkaliphilum]
MKIFYSLIVAAFTLSGCSLLYDKHVEWEYVEPENYPVLTAVGYAPIDEQSGSSASLKMLQAVKASKLDAYRELAEQVYGHKVNADQSLSNMLLENEQLQSSVQGVIRGAKVVRTYAVGENTYATELELDMQKVYDIYLSVAKPRRIKDVKYY